MSNTRGIKSRAFNCYAAMMAVLCSSALSLSSGCVTNNLSLDSISSSGFTSGSPYAGTNDEPYSTSFYLSLSRVVASPSDPSKYLDLYGDGSGAIGDTCVSTGTAGAANEGASNCGCHFEYTKTDGSIEAYNTDTTYREANMVRCSYSGIPAGTTTMKVRIQLLNQDSYSNYVQFSFTANGLVLSISDETTYVKALRYQCTDGVNIPNILDDSIYDPFLSTSPEFAYTMNYYTTNPGSAILSFVNNSSTKPVNGWGYICPNRTTFTEEGVGDGRSDNDSYDLRIFSLGAAGGSKTIWPISGTDRHTFYLAKSATGIFNVPVNTLIAPATITDNDDSTSAPPSIGFAAASIPTGSDTEECPSTSAVIPPNMKWVKLWLFRAPLAARKAPSSQNINDLGYIACNPSGDDAYKPTWSGGSSGTCTTSDWADANNFCVYGTWMPSAAGKLFTTIPKCENKLSQYENALFTPEYKYDKYGISLKDLAQIPQATRDTNHIIANRLLYANSYSMCIGVKPGEMDLLDTASTPNSYMPEGADVWFPRSFDPTVDPETGLAGGATASDLFTDCTTENAESWDSMNICNYIFKRLDGKFNGAPHDSEPGTNDIDSGHSRFDVLFVTSPANIHTADMRERNDYAAPYIPYRFYSPNDCQASTPDAAAPGDCANDKIIDYYLELRNLMVASGSPVNDPEQSRHFPLCVLQKIDE